MFHGCDLKTKQKKSLLLECTNDNLKFKIIVQIVFHWYNRWISQLPSFLCFYVTSFTDWATVIDYVSILSNCLSCVTALSFASQSYTLLFQNTTSTISKQLSTNVLSLRRSLVGVRIRHMWTFKWWKIKITGGTAGIEMK